MGTLTEVAMRMTRTRLEDGMGVVPMLDRVERMTRRM